MPSLRIELSGDDDVRIDVDGCVGPVCKNLTSALLQRVRVTNIEDDEKPEFREHTVEQSAELGG